MSCNCKDCRCDEILSLIHEYIDVCDDDGSLIPDDDEWSDRIEELRNEMRNLLLTKE